MRERRRIRKEFRYQKMDEVGFDLSFVLAEKFTEIADWLDEHCKRCPELFVSIRKLEEASFYARKALAQNYAKQYPQNSFSVDCDEEKTSERDND